MHRQIAKTKAGVVDRRYITGEKGAKPGPVPYRSREAWLLPLHPQHNNPNEYTGKLKEGRDPFAKNPVDNLPDDVRQRAERSYYDNLKSAAHTVAAINKHPDFKGAWHTTRMDTTGKSSAELSDTAKKHGVKSKTVKGDVAVLKSKDPNAPYRGVKAISLKQGAGAQAESAGPNRTGALYDCAFQSMFGHKRLKEASEDNPTEYTRADQVHAYKTLAKIKEHMRLGRHKEADVVVKQLHHRFPELKKHLWFHSMSGEGIMKGREGTATHIATLGKNATLKRTKDWVDDFEKDNGTSLPIPSVSKGKHASSTSGKKVNPLDTALRLRIPPKKKTT